MATLTSTKKIAVAMKLDNGTTSTGTVKTVSVPLGTIDAENMNTDKAYAIAMKLMPCLNKSMYELEQTVISSIYED